MIIGSGLIAKAFIDGGAHALRDTCFYAAGVSNSGCQDEREYLRERARLNAAMDGCRTGERLVYFSSCSIEDPASRDSAYVQHKIRMENLVRERARHLILAPAPGGRQYAESPYAAELSARTHRAL